MVFVNAVNRVNGVNAVGNIAGGIDLRWCATGKVLRGTPKYINAKDKEDEEDEVDGGGRRGRWWS